MGGPTESPPDDVSFPGLGTEEAVITGTLASPAGLLAPFHIHIPFPTSLKLFTVSANNRQIVGAQSMCFEVNERRNEGMKGLDTALPTVLDSWGGCSSHQHMASRAFPRWGPDVCRHLLRLSAEHLLCAGHWAGGRGRTQSGSLGAHSQVHAAFLSVTHFSDLWWFVRVRREAVQCEGSAVAVHTGFGARLRGVWTG